MQAYASECKQMQANASRRKQRSKCKQMEAKVREWKLQQKQANLSKRKQLRANTSLDPRSQASISKCYKNEWKINIGVNMYWKQMEN